MEDEPLISASAARVSVPWRNSLDSQSVDSSSLLFALFLVYYLLRNLK